MSDEIATPEVEPVVDGSTVSPSDISEAPDTPVLSVDEYSNYRVPIKIDGEELQVPLSEALAGYQRQSDYTRKTQELSQQRDQLQFAAALQSALETDPQTTIDLLMDHYGISRKAATQMAEQVEEWAVADDPIEQRYRELDKRIASFEDYQSQQQVEREIQSLQSKYSDFDVKEVVSAALRMGTNDLEGVYKQLAFDRMVAQAQLAKAAQERQQQADAAVLEAKRAASVVSGGASATASTTNDTFVPITSVADAWEAAKRQMGAS
jgi:hypothetical protein